MVNKLALDVMQGWGMQVFDNHTYVSSDITKFHEPLPVVLHESYSEDEDGMDALYALLHRYSFFIASYVLTLF